MSNQAVRIRVMARYARLMNVSCAAAAILLFVFFISSPLSADWAIAFSNNGGGGWSVGSSWNSGTRSAAVSAAISNCRARGGRNCRVVGQGSNGCFSIAVTNDGGWGTYSGQSQYQAQQNSIARCLQSNVYGGCIVRQSFCDTTRGFRPADAAAPTGGINNCRSPVDYNACVSPGQGHSPSYCRMVFC